MRQHGLTQISLALVKAGKIGHATFVAVLLALVIIVATVAGLLGTSHGATVLKAWLTTPPSSSANQTGKQAPAPLAPAR